MAVNLQSFDSEAIKQQIAENFILEAETEPTKNIIKLLTLDGRKSIASIKYLAYGGGTPYVKPTTQPSTLGLSINVSLAKFPLPNTDITLFNFETGKRLGVVKTDENGQATYNLSATEPGSGNILAAIGERDKMPLFPAMNPFADMKPFSFWYIVIKATALKDRWARHCGRAINRDLPVFFYRYRRYILGVLAGYYTFAEIIPVAGTQRLRYEVGISAWCDTASPNPTHEECCANQAWWDVKVYATNDKRKISDARNGHPELLIGGDKINVKYHLVYWITPQAVVYEGRTKVSDWCEEV